MPSEPAPATAGAGAAAASGRVGWPGPSWPGSGRPQAEDAPRGREAKIGADDAVAGLRLASFWRRALGFALDTLVLWLLLLMFGTLSGLSPGLVATEADATALFLVNLFFQLGYYWLWNSLGWSPGKRAVGLRIVGEDGRRPGPDRGFRRTVGSLVSGLALLVGYLWAAWDRRSQTWHDKMAGTYVVIAPPPEEDRTGAGPPASGSRP